MVVKDSSLSYEDVRKERLEENKKRMQELGLTDLSRSLASSFSRKSPNARRVKPRVQKETIFIDLRRSSRVASNPQPDYCESRHVKPPGPKDTSFMELRRSLRIANNPRPDYCEAEIDTLLIGPQELYTV